MYKAFQLDHHAAMAIAFSISHKLASNTAALKLHLLSEWHLTVMLTKFFRILHWSAEKVVNSTTNRRVPGH